MLTPHAHQLLSDRNLQIGNICFQWAHLEFLVALALWSLLRIDQETGKILTGSLDLLPRVNMALKLAKHLKAPGLAIKALKEVRTALQGGLIERRNTAIHGLRSLDPNDPAGEFFEVHRGKSSGVKQPVNNAALRALGSEIVDVHKAFYAAMTETCIYDAVSSRPARIIATNASRRTGANESELGS